MRAPQATAHAPLGARQRNLALSAPTRRDALVRVRLVALGHHHVERGRPGDFTRFSKWPTSSSEHRRCVLHAYPTPSTLSTLGPTRSVDPPPLSPPFRPQRECCRSTRPALTAPNPPALCVCCTPLLAGLARDLLGASARSWVRSCRTPRAARDDMRLAAHGRHRDERGAVARARRRPGWRPPGPRPGHGTRRCGRWGVSSGTDGMGPRCRCYEVSVEPLSSL